MSGLAQRTAQARSLLLSMAEGDIVLRKGEDGWRSVPARAPDAEGAIVDGTFVRQLLSAGLLADEGRFANVTARGQRFCRSGTGVRTTPATKKPARSRPAPAGPVANAAESPVAWLRSRKGPDGNPLLGDAAFRAAERLRADFTHAGLTPRMSVNLEASAPRRGKKSGAKGPADVLDAALTAQTRMRAALNAAGIDLAGLLIDVCCHLKSLGEVERERGWPKRSAKVVLDIALSRLADHYGYADEARGRRRTRSVRHWGTEDYRPTME